MDIGFRHAGFSVRACSEIDPNASATLRLNESIHGTKTRVYEGDVRLLSPQGLMSDLGLKKGELDVLFGGPPCQSFSQAGKKRSLMDPRGMLVFEMHRFASVLQPKAVVIEQVRGFLSAGTPDDPSPGSVLRMVTQQLAQLGYKVSWRLLNAADYGVPQLRYRVILVAVRTNNEYQFPVATHSDVTETDLLGVLPYKTVGSVISGLPVPVLMESAQEEQLKFSHVDPTPLRDRERIHFVPEGRYLAAQRHLPANLLCSLSEKDTTKFLRVDRNRPSNTLRGGEIFFHFEQDRYLTPRECMRIHGYPDDYLLCGPIRRRTPTSQTLCQHKQVANSVPPPLAQAIAHGLKSHLVC